MATAAVTASVKQNFPFVATQLTDIEHTVTAPQKNIRNGPAALLAIWVGNTVTASGKSYVKVYDVVDDTFVAGSSAPMIGFPVRAVGTNPVAGILNIEIRGSLRFINGISVLASQEDGDEMTAAPAQSVDAIFITDK